MTTEDITIAIRFEAVDIALEIQAAEDLMKRQESTSAKECTKAAAYDQIIDLIYGGEME